MANKIIFICVKFQFKIQFNFFFFSRITKKSNLPLRTVFTFGFFQLKLTALQV